MFEIGSVEEIESYKQGWGIFCRSDNGFFELCKLDDPEEVADSYGIEIANTFETDPEAARFVQNQADKGVAVCRKAIEFLIENNSPDIVIFDLQKNW